MRRQSRSRHRWCSCAVGAAAISTASAFLHLLPSRTMTQTEALWPRKGLPVNYHNMWYSVCETSYVWRRLSSCVAFAQVKAPEVKASHSLRGSHVLVGRSTIGGKRAQRLKDLLLDKELRSDISTAEFALTLDVPSESPRDNSTTAMTRGGLIDYEKIADRLEKNLELIDRRQWRLVGLEAEKAEGVIATQEHDEVVDSTRDIAMRLKQTRTALKAVLARVRESMREQRVRFGPSSSSFQTIAGPAGLLIEGGLETKGEGTDSEDKRKGENPLTVFVREDGTVDWDGALQSAGEFARLSGELLERLQGKSPGEEVPAPRVSQIAAIDARPNIRSLSEKLVVCEASLQSADEDRERLQDLHRALRQNGLEVSKAQKGELRIAEDQAIEFQRRVELQRLDVDMERICAYIEQEIEQSTSFREQKLLVAEYGLLDAQLTTLLGMLQSAEAEVKNLVDLDENELQVVAGEVQDLKTRLGLVEDEERKRMEWGKMTTYVSESLAKIRKGVGFYLTGAKLLASDLQGYTLKPREVRTLQRTAKDVLTLIPFTIILIIPMTPVGHVLVFSLLQRIFPGFFPSTFTERRQELSRMYEELDKRPPAAGGP